MSTPKKHGLKAAALAGLSVLLLFCGCTKKIGQMIRSGGPFNSEYKEEFRQDVDDIKGLKIGEIAGNVRVEFGEGDSASVLAIKTIRAHSEDEAKGHSEEVKIVVEQKGAMLNVHTKYPENVGIPNFSGFVDYVVKLPLGASVEAETVSGDIRVVAGAGSVKANSISGDVVVEGADLDVSVTAVSGEAQVSDCGGPIDVETVSGSIAYSAKTPPQSDLRLHTVSGGVSAEIPEDSDIEVEFSTVSGDIETKAPLTEQKLSSRFLKGKRNLGTYKLNVETVSGSIELK